jgi:hypothetical protein
MGTVRTLVSSTPKKNSPLTGANSKFELDYHLFETLGGVPPRCWYVDVADSELETERAFLRAEIYQMDLDPLVRRVDAFDRFSNRV